MARKKEMKKEREEKQECCKPHWHHHAKGCGGGYCLGVIGAAIYYISTAGSFWMGVLGILKAIVWPVFVVHGLLKLIGA